MLSCVRRTTSTSFPAVWHRLNLELSASPLYIVTEVCQNVADTWRRAPDGCDLEPLNPLVDAAGSLSPAAFRASLPPIADDTAALDRELLLLKQDAARVFAYSSQRGTVAPGPLQRAPYRARSACTKRADWTPPP